MWGGGAVVEHGALRSGCGCALLLGRRVHEHARNHGLLIVELNALIVAAGAGRSEGRGGEQVEMGRLLVLVLVLLNLVVREGSSGGFVSSAQPEVERGDGIIMMVIRVGGHGHRGLQVRRRVGRHGRRPGRGETCARGRRAEAGRHAHAAVALADANATIILAEEHARVRARAHAVGVVMVVAAAVAAVAQVMMVKRSSSSASAHASGNSNSTSVVLAALEPLAVVAVVLDEDAIARCGSFRGDLRALAQLRGLGELHHVVLRVVGVGLVVELRDDLLHGRGIREHDEPARRLLVFGQDLDGEDRAEGRAESAQGIFVAADGEAADEDLLASLAVREAHVQRVLPAERHAAVEPSDEALGLVDLVEDHETAEVAVAVGPAEHAHVLGVEGLGDVAELILGSMQRHAANENLESLLRGGGSISNAIGIGIGKRGDGFFRRANLKPTKFVIMFLNCFVTKFTILVKLNCIQQAK